MQLHVCVEVFCACCSLCCHVRACNQADNCHFSSVHPLSLANLGADMSFKLPIYTQIYTYNTYICMYVCGILTAPSTFSTRLRFQFSPAFVFNIVFVHLFPWCCNVHFRLSFLHATPSSLQVLLFLLFAVVASTYCLAVIFGNVSSCLFRLMVCARVVVICSYNSIVVVVTFFVVVVVAYSYI